MALSLTELMIAAGQAGFPADQLPTAAAVAMAESSGRPDVRNSIGASGLWQILQSAHPELFTKYKWQNPNDNAKMAYQVYKNAGNKWTPWVGYTNGNYRHFLTKAQDTFQQNRDIILKAGTKPSDPLGAVQGAGSALLKPFTDLANDFQKFGELIGLLLMPSTWVRISAGVGGGIMVVIAVILLGKEARG